MRWASEGLEQGIEEVGGIGIDLEDAFGEMVDEPGCVRAHSSQTGQSAAKLKIALGGGGLSGKTLLIQRNDASDPECGGAYTVKRFMRKGNRVVLKAKNPKYDITLRDEAEYSTKYRAIAEFKEVL